MITVLNLYAGVGGNRALWPHEINGEGVAVTAVERDPEIAEAYQALWPDDEVIIGDAHEYLLDTIKSEFRLRWTSPPCQSHSKLNRFIAGRSPQKIRYPEIDQLYGEILLLQAFVPKGSSWLVENVIPYYQTLIPPTTQLGRHYAWSNIALPFISQDHTGMKISRDRKGDYAKMKPTLSPMECAETSDFEQDYGITLPACAAHWGRQKRRQVMRNCVDPTIGLAVWDAIFGVAKADQGTLWEVPA